MGRGKRVELGIYDDAWIHGDDCTEFIALPAKQTKTFQVPLPDELAKSIETNMNKEEIEKKIKEVIYGIK